MEVFDAIQKLAETPVPTILIVAGIFFLFVAVGGQVGAKLLTTGVKTKSAGILGVTLLLMGVGLHLSAKEETLPKGKELEERREKEPYFPGEPGRPPEGMEINIARPGLDFDNFDLPDPEPHLCQDACNRNDHCRAWTYVKPGVQGDHARCWLKNPVPPAERNECCISGVKG